MSTTQIHRSTFPEYRLAHVTLRPSLCWGAMKVRFPPVGLIPIGAVDIIEGGSAGPTRYAVAFQMGEKGWVIADGVRWIPWEPTQCARLIWGAVNRRFGSAFCEFAGISSRTLEGWIGGRTVPIEQIFDLYRFLDDLSPSSVDSIPVRARKSRKKDEPAS